MSRCAWTAPTRDAAAPKLFQAIRPRLESLSSPEGAIASPAGVADEKVGAALEASIRRTVARAATFLGVAQADPHGSLKAKLMPKPR
jgi:hypothetical protein